MQRNSAGLHHNIKLITMKKLFVLMPLLLLCYVGFAKENKAERKKDRQIEMQHSIEITTGYPSYLLRAEFPWFNPPEGKEYKKYYQPGLNLGYVFSWGKRWEASVMVNAFFTVYDVMQYPSITDESGETVYDNSADPFLEERVTTVSGSASILCRYKWLVRDKFCMYSSLGVGGFMCSPFGYYKSSSPNKSVFPSFVPYIAPVGIKFGKGRVYGIAELNFTPANMYGMAGIGVRL